MLPEYQQFVKINIQQATYAKFVVVKIGRGVHGKLFVRRLVDKGWSVERRRKHLVRLSCAWFESATNCSVLSKNMDRWKDIVPTVQYTKRQIDATGCIKSRSIKDAEINALPATTQSAFKYSRIQETEWGIPREGTYEENIYPLQCDCGWCSGRFGSSRYENRKK